MNIPIRISSFALYLCSIIMFRCWSGCLLIIELIMLHIYSTCFLLSLSLSPALSSLFSLSVFFCLFNSIVVIDKNMKRIFLACRSILINWWDKFTNNKWPSVSCKIIRWQKTTNTYHLINVIERKKEICANIDRRDAYQNIFQRVKMKKWLN